MHQYSTPRCDIDMYSYSLVLLARFGEYIGQIILFQIGPSIEFRKANTEPYMHFRRANMADPWNSSPALHSGNPSEEPFQPFEYIPSSFT